MTPIQPSTRWVSIKLLAAACAAVCVLLLAAGAWPGTSQATPSAQGSMASTQVVVQQGARAAQVQRSADVARAAAVHTLASRTRALRSCERRHPDHCATASRAVASAQHTVAEIRERWARWWKQHQAPPAQSKPGAGSSGSSGSPSGGSSSGPSGSSGFSKFSGSSGSYGSSAGSTGSSGSSSGSTGSGSGGSTAGGSGSSGTGSPPSEAPSQSATTFQPGINSGSAALWELPGAVKLGAKVVRVGLEINEPMTQIEPIIEGYAAQGIRVAPLVEFNGRLPSPAEAKNLASWAKAFGPGGTFWATHAGGQFAIQTIEFGNETSYNWQYSENEDTPAGYASRAQTYALRFAEAAEAIKATDAGVGLLAQADSGNAGPAWVENMFKAVPDFASLVAGWTVHPYGPQWQAKVEEVISQTTAAGAPSSIPIDITEWGISSDNGACLSGNYGWNPCMTYGEAGEALSRSVAQMREVLHGRLGLFLLYKIRDQKAPGESTYREEYFGALGNELQPKGAFTTTVEEMLAS
jgi:hypothetical protein